MSRAGAAAVAAASKSTTTGGGGEQSLPAGVTLDGELKQWHAIELNLAGPSSSETAATFRDNRFVVTFTQAGQPSQAIPGYFAADGNAADTGATSGTVWRCIFRPSTTGRWDFTIAFHTGANIAASAPGVGGTPTANNGKSGWLTVAASDKVGLDMRAPNRGRLVGIGVDHVLHFASDPDHHEIWCGPGGPEGMFAYSEFDGTQGYSTDPDRATHPWTAHAGHWRTGDPVWQAKDSYGVSPPSTTGGASVTDAGKGMIGALNYLADQGVNTIYLVNYSIDGGDGRATYPWVPAATQLTNPHNIYDCSKLDQWNIVFEHANSVGITVMFLFRERENWDELDYPTMGTIDKVYAREIAARFGHLPGIIWVISEETGGIDAMDATDQAYLLAWADWIDTIDGYGNLTTTHNNSGEEAATFGFPGIQGRDTFDGIAHQAAGGVSNHTILVTYRPQSAAAGRPWVIMNAETFNNPLNPDSSGTTDAWRRVELWPSLIGGAGVFGYFGAVEDQGDLDARQFTSRVTGWLQARLARNAVRDYLPNLAATEIVDGRVSGVAGSLCLRRTGHWYAVFVPPGAGTIQLSLAGEAGTWTVRWLDTDTFAALSGAGAPPTVTGGGTVSLPARPNTTDDWVGLVIKQTAAPTVRAIAMQRENRAELGYMYDGMVIDIAKPIWQQPLGFKALCDPGLVGSVAFVNPTGSLVATAIESTPPYDFTGGAADNSLVGRCWTPTIGSRSISATPWTGSGATGTAGPTLTIGFSVIDSGAAAVFVVHLQRYRFYTEGPEDTAPALAAENTALTISADSNVAILLRLGLQEVGGGSMDGATTDDYAIDRSINGGAFAPVNQTSTGARANTSSVLVNGALTTQRLSSGSGSFVPGEQDQNEGVIENCLLTANNFTEHVFAVTAVGSQLSDGDVITFRALLNGVPITSSVTPTLVVTKTPANGGSGDGTPLTDDGGAAITDDDATQITDL